MKTCSDEALIMELSECMPVESKVKSVVVHKGAVMVSGRYKGYKVAFVPATVLVMWLLKFNQNPHKEAIKKRDPAYLLLEHYIKAHHETIYIEYLKDSHTAKKFIATNF